MRELFVCAAILVGTFFMFVASFGLLRLPDFYLRVHAPTKAATLGLFTLVLALLVAVPAVPVSIGMLAGLFIGVTIPISAHILTRGAYRHGLRARGATVDEYSEYAADAGPQGPSASPPDRERPAPASDDPNA